MSGNVKGAKALFPALPVIVIAIASFLFFGVFFRDQTPAIATEIAAAFLGALITVLITMMLLTKQSESQRELLSKQSEVQEELLSKQVQAERSREMGATFLAQKISTYNDLISEVKDILVKGSSEPKDTIALQIVNQKIALYGSKDVLKGFGFFTSEYGKMAVDGEIDEDERESLVALLADLSGKMRRDLGTGGDLSPLDEKEIVESVKVNAKALSIKTTKEDFLENCEGDEIEYYRGLFDFLERNKTNYVMGQKGLSIRNRAGRPRVRCYPTRVSRSIEIANKGLLHAATIAKVREMLPPQVAAGIRDDRTYITVTPADLPLGQLLKLIELLTR